jgi:hypothetical protein
MLSMHADLAWAGVHRRHTAFSARSADGRERSLGSPNLSTRRFREQNGREAAWGLALRAIMVCNYGLFPIVLRYLKLFLEDCSTDKL